jgi:hypothetical protein
MAEKEKERPPLHPSRFQLAEHRRQIWHIVPEHGTALAELLTPAYWSHVSRQMRPSDRIEVNAEDGSFFAELVVIDAGLQFAKVALLREAKLEGVEASQTSLPGHKVEWSGPHTKFRVVRESDRKVLKDGFTTRADAGTWLSNHAKALAA